MINNQTVLHEDVITAVLVSTIVQKHHKNVGSLNLIQQK